MKGLLLKDLYVAKTMAKSYGLMMGLFAVLSAVGPIRRGHACRALLEALAPLLGAAALAVSYFVSCAIYRKKEL